MSKYCYLLFILIITILISHYSVYASEGDLDPIFKSCVENCTQTLCTSNNNKLDFQLRLLFWTCPSNCDYTCMQNITDKAIEEGTTVYQYFGKWPFYRVLGIQEPASVVFSIGNGLVHFYFYRAIKRQQVPSTTYHLKPFMLLYTIIGMNAWFWSTVFHSRDVKFTELMDYFSAGLFVMYTFYFALLRVFQHVFFPRSNSYYWRSLLLGGVFIMLYAIHVGYLTFVVFDYVYNMAANVVVGVCQIITWIGWYLMHHKSRPYAYLAIIPGVGVVAALSLELFDFPPLWRVFDAHSLWHFSTIPLSIIWYCFLLEDMRYETRQYQSLPK